MADPARAPRTEEDLLPKKEVSASAQSRLAVAKQAIATTKAVMSFGAGNQVEALKATNLNSKHRLQVMRHDPFWELAPGIRALAAANPEALIAAKADLAHGGNCGEHAWVAYHYLRQHASGQNIQVSAKDGLDHAFVLIGDVQGADKDSDLAVADPWPTRPVTVFCPFPPGISTDILARAVATYLGDTLGQQFVMENRPGANGNIGAGAAAKAAPDGYTFVVATLGPIVANKFMYKTMSYDPERAFAPVYQDGQVVDVLRQDRLQPVVQAVFPF